jgi:hypothetical protein
MNDKFHRRKVNYCRKSLFQIRHTMMIMAFGIWILMELLVKKDLGLVYGFFPQMVTPNEGEV